MIDNPRLEACKPVSRDAGYTVEHVAIALRRGHYSYVSLESALSEYGAISQVPLSVARARTALSDLQHVGRNLHLVDYEELEDVA